MKDLETHPFYLKTRNEIQKEIDSIDPLKIKESRSRNLLPGILQKRMEFPEELEEIIGKIIFHMLYELFQPAFESVCLSKKIIVTLDITPAGLILIFDSRYINK